MKKTLLSLLAGATLLVALQSGCERHAASQTVPGFEEKAATRQEEQQRAAQTPVTINPDAPQFFPPKTTN